MSIEESAKTLEVDGRAVPGVESPRSIDDLQALLRDTDDSLLITGGGTGLSTGNLGGPFDLAVSTRGLVRILHHEPADMTVAVEPGVTVSQLVDALAASNQTLPFDCPDPERVTIGGLFASGSGGPRRLRYGSLRDWVLGIDVVDGDGVVTRSGGMVVKNVTGYDLARLHHGAYGAFGIVTRLNLKVLPREPTGRSIQLRFATVDAAHAAGVAVLGSQLEPTSIVISNEDGWSLWIGCEGPAETIDWQAQAIVDAATAASVPVQVSMVDDTSAATHSYRSVVAGGAGRSVARLAIPASRQVEALEVYGSLAHSAICADLGSGLVYLSGPSSIEWREAIRQTADRPVFLTLPAELKQGLDVFGGMDAPNARIVERLKTAYDPGRRFNRGRFVLGL